MVISAITKAIAKASAKKMKKKYPGLSKKRVQALKDKANNNAKKKYNQNNKVIKEKYDQDEHVKSNKEFQLDDMDRHHDGLARADRMTGRLVDPDDPHAIHSQDLDDYTGIEGRLSPGTALKKKKILDAKRLEIQKRETEREAHLMGSSDPTDSTIPKKKANLAQYHSSNMKFGKAKGPKELRKSREDPLNSQESYQRFVSPNKIEILPRNSVTGKEIKGKGTMPVKTLWDRYPERFGTYDQSILRPNEPLWGGAHDVQGLSGPIARIGPNQPNPGFVRASKPGEPFVAFSDGTIETYAIKKKKVKMSGAKTTKYQKSLKANKLPGKIKNKYKQFNEVDPVTGGYAHFGFGIGNKKKTSTSTNPPGKLKKFWDDWMFPSSD
tara:strand:+ start:20854 stop:21996 length:1143 start_codon:yes stop_codon:yes gene_type:complete